jgi:hypothetical protein
LEMFAQRIDYFLLLYKGSRGFNKYRSYETGIAKKKVCPKCRPAISR